MPMAGSMDLLGLGPGEQPQAPAEDCGSQPAQQMPPPPRSFSRIEEDELVAYPPAWGADPIREEAESSTAATGSGAVGPHGRRLRQFTVRCEGRWRVRSAPSLNSKVIGSIANGTLVVGEDELPPGPPRRPLRPEGSQDPTNGDDQAHQAMIDSLNCLWVVVARLEAKEPAGVSEIKRDTASGGAMFCLRRNALGYGLYEEGIEPLDGPLLLLPEDLASDLRGDAQRANVEKNEDVSLTWKLLSAADSFSRLFSAPDTGEVGECSNDLKAPLRKRPEEVFEVKQRELLKKAAKTMHTATSKLAVTGSGREDLTAQLPKDVRGRYARLRVAVEAASANLPGNNESEPVASAASQAPEGSCEELQRFAAHCSRLERSGGWPELSHEARQEIINFSQKHATDLENHARSLAKGRRKSGGDDGTNGYPSSANTSGSMNSPRRARRQSEEAASEAAKTDNVNLLGGEVATNSPQRQAGVAPTGFGGLCPLLPPPPPPSSGVSTARLV